MAFYAQQGWAAPGARPSQFQAGPAAKRARTASAAGTATGEVRFADAAAAQHAAQLSGSMIDGYAIEVELDQRSKDQTKIVIRGLPEGYAWTNLKTHFEQCGSVKFADVKSAGGSTAEVRYDDATHAQAAVATLNGSVLGGAVITVSLDTNSQDGTKLNVGNVPAGIEWQELKDHFKQCGTVAFVSTAASSGSSGGAEVRYDDPTHAQMAVSTLNGSMLGGNAITVSFDPNSQDGAKLIVGNVPAGIEWQELKDHFKQCGTVAFAKTAGGKGGKGGKGGAGGGKGQMADMQQQMQMMMMMQAMAGKGCGKGWW